PHGGQVERRRRAVRRGCRRPGRLGGLVANAYHSPIPAAPHSAGAPPFFNATLQPGGISTSAQIAVDDSSGPGKGNVYIVYCDRLPATVDYDIFLIRSTDGGMTWSAPIRVNDDPRGNGHDQFNPA